MNELQKKFLEEFGRNNKALAFWEGLWKALEKVGIRSPESKEISYPLIFCDLKTVLEKTKFLERSDPTNNPFRTEEINGTHFFSLITRLKNQINPEFVDAKLKINPYYEGFNAISKEQTIDFPIFELSSNKYYFPIYEYLTGASIQHYLPILERRFSNYFVPNYDLSERWKEKCIKAYAFGEGLYTFLIKAGFSASDSTELSSELIFKDIKTIILKSNLIQLFHYRKQLQHASNYFYGLEELIREYRNLLQEKETEDTSWVTAKSSYIVKSYREISIGRQTDVFIRESWLSKYEDRQPPQYLFEESIKGAIIAFHLPEMEKELQQYKVNGAAGKFAQAERASIPPNIEPMIWTGEKVLLGFLIQWLKDNNFISKNTSRDSSILNHFVDERGKPITSIKQALNNVKKLNEGSLPKNYEKIEPLLKTLLDLRTELENTD